MLISLGRLIVAISVWLVLRVFDFEVVEDVLDAAEMLEVV